MMRAAIGSLAPAAFVDGERAAPVDAMHAGNRAPPRGRSRRRVEVADISQCQRTEPGRAEPERSGERRQRADHARMGVAAMRERQQKQLKVLRPSFGGSPARGRDDAGGFIRDDVEQICKTMTAWCVPQVQELLVLELAPEQRAHARAGETERMTAMAFEFQDEHVAEGASDRARLDLAPFR